MVYETGLEHFQTLICQDQDQNYEGSSDPTMISCAGHAFHQLNLTLGHIKSKRMAGRIGSAFARGQRFSPPDPREASVGTHVSWSILNKNAEQQESPEGNQRRKRLDLGSMSNVIAVIIPWVFTLPSVADSLNRLLRGIAERDLFLKGSASQTIELQPHPKYFAFYCLDTEEYRKLQYSRGPEESRSLSNSPITRNGLVSGKAVGKIGRASSFAFDLATSRPPKPFRTPFLFGKSEKSHLEVVKRNQSALDSANHEMKRWVLEEKGVMVQCRLYVSAVVALSASLVIGGISIGITVGDRIPEVDPFNITTYCWVLAAFVVLVFKSIRVRDWPWNDFLHGQVLCRSVSELASVTGIQDQLIIAYLLYREPTSWLRTRGPFNNVFDGVHDDGFSIDRLIITWAML
ncbi:uncharacterized protein PODANS_6_8880 [Podospora anserina S mat+]|uniref:Podospora anserina S mat+ genomic DNA chromosome 6, supercontig 4 n=1 Tax=Podospora anserina (strain S / ATCC MYA-4624 / DSM 980 / FGSC 10383) TaxID=515849 RepID=B2AN40_PODAN|nr:uncharacterized protein PODANS_6_8880 [Podospora anserina S mat+]CAP65382.1 unnamed protein product [Podospora anserina S mat+]CDP31376.1 Putative protein of unknown function [Podospora anserina S mat+]